MVTMFTSTLSRCCPFRGYMSALLACQLRPTQPSRHQAGPRDRGLVVVAAALFDDQPPRRKKQPYIKPKKQPKPPAFTPLEGVRLATVCRPEVLEGGGRGWVHWWASAKESGTSMWYGGAYLDHSAW